MDKIPCGVRIYSRDGSFRGHACSREAMWTQKDEPGLGDVYCNVHKAGMNRRTYGTYNFKPLSDRDRARLHELVKARNEEDHKRKEAERAEQERWNTEHQEKAWASLNEKPVLTVTEDEYALSRLDYRDREWTYLVKGASDSFGVNFDLKTESKGYPYGIRLRSTGSLTPNGARLLGNALVAAAAAADSLNAELEA